MSSQMKNQNFRRNGLSDDYGGESIYNFRVIKSSNYQIYTHIILDNRRPIHVQRGDDCGSSDAQSMNFSMSSHNPSTNMRNLGSYKTTNAGYPTQAVTCHRPVSSPYSPPFYMPTSRSAHIGDNVASLLQNSLHCSQKNEKSGGCVQSGNSEYSNIQSQYMLDSGYYGNNQQEQTFSMGNYRAGDGKQFMGIMDNIEIPETTQLDDDSYSGEFDYSKLFFFSINSKLIKKNHRQWTTLLLRRGNLEALSN